MPPRRKTTAIALVVLLSPLIIPLTIIGVLFHFLNRAATYLLIWILWLPRGKSVLFVSSDSPIWERYMSDQVLSLVNDRARILNWSERRNWPSWSFTVHVFRTFGRGREFNPMVVVFKRFRRAEYFRFLVPFQAWKRGDTSPVEELRQKLAASLQNEKRVPGQTPML